jgi:hypothetical protein
MIALLKALLASLIVGLVMSAQFYAGAAERESSED